MLVEGGEEEEEIETGRREPSERDKRTVVAEKENVRTGDGRWRGETERGWRVKGEVKWRKAREGRGDLRVKRIAGEVGKRIS